MALALYDRVQETTTTSGTGSVTLSGAVAGYQSFAVVGNNNTCYYTIVDGSAWEVGLGTYSTTGPTLARTTVYSNSNGTTSPITLSSSANTKSVFLTYPAEKSINYDANGVATIGSVLGYSDTGIIGSFASTVAGYNQVILQNKSNATNASCNFNVSNDVGTSGANFAEFGINSSTFSGTGAFNIAGAAYLASASTDLAIGTYGAYNIHFVTNSSTTDAMTIYNSGGVSLGGQPDPGLGTLYANNVYIGFTTVTAAAGTTVLTNSSSGWIQVVGTTTQTIQLPNATTLYKGLAYTIANNSTGNVTIKDNAGTTIDTTVTGGSSILVLTANGTSAGTWVAYSYIPASYDFSSSTANFGSASITNAVWNGTTIASGYGGTGLTTFTAANNAIYSTSSSALTAGTLPVAAGGTGATTLTGYVYGNGTSAMTASTSIPTSALTGNFVSTFSAGTTGLTPSTATTGAVTLAGTLGVGNGGTGLTSTPANGALDIGNGTGFTRTTLTGTASQVSVTNGAGSITLSLPSTINVNTSGSAGSVANAVTFNNGGAGGVSGSTFNGSGALTVSYNTIGAQVAGTYVTSVTGTSPVSSSGGTTPAISLASGYGDTQNPYASKTANYFLAAPNGSAGAPTFRTVVAADIPTLNQNTTGTASNVTGTVAIANGGTGLTSTPANGALDIGNGTGFTRTTLTAGTAIGVTNGSGSITINNTGVTSAVAGTGISVSGATGAVTISIPQAVATSSSVQFGSFGVGTAASGTTGEIRATNNVTAYYSDDRMKTNLGNIPNALDKLKTLNGFYYEANELAQSMGYEVKKEVGVSAQQVQAIMPEVVAPAPIDENYLTVRYERLVPLLIEAIKELEAQVAELKAR